MLDIKYIEFINEEMAVISTRKLRDAIHDILVELKPEEILNIEDLSNILMRDYKIIISPLFLDNILDNYIKVKRGDKKTKTLFLKSDIIWLGVRDVKGSKEIRNNFHFQKSLLGKHKRKLYAEEENQRLEDAYNTGMKDLDFSEDVIKKSLVLQKPADSKEIMKLIYNDVIFRKLYDNTYDNCWKLAMLIGKNNKLDRIRGWFKLAPQKVKNEYYNEKEGERKINYELTKPKKKADPKKSDEINSTTDKNLKIVDEHLEKYSSWEKFKNNTNMENMIKLIDSIKTKNNIEQRSIQQFVSKIDQLNLILIRFYQVNKIDIIYFYKNIGLADFMKRWQMTFRRPKINNF